MPNKARPTMERRRLSFPSTDTTVRDWLGAQSDPSASMRLIIRDTVAREGYSDVMCRRVEQQPQRGRPRVAATVAAATTTGAEQSGSEVRVEPVPSVHVPEHPVAEDTAQQSQLEQARLRQHPEPVNQALQGSQVQVDQVSSSPSSDVEDFFSAMRP